MQFSIHFWIPFSFDVDSEHNIQNPILNPINMPIERKMTLGLVFWIQGLGLRVQGPYKNIARDNVQTNNIPIERNMTLGPTRKCVHHIYIYDSRTAKRAPIGQHL